MKLLKVLKFYENFELFKKKINFKKFLKFIILNFEFFFLFLKFSEIF